VEQHGGPHVDAGSHGIDVESVHGSMAHLPHFLVDPHVSVPCSPLASPENASFSRSSNPLLHPLSIRTTANAAASSATKGAKDNTGGDGSSAVASDSTSDFSYGSESDGSDDVVAEERRTLRAARKALRAARRAARHVRSASRAHLACRTGLACFSVICLPSYQTVSSHVPWQKPACVTFVPCALAARKLWKSVQLAGANDRALPSPTAISVPPVDADDPANEAAPAVVVRSAGDWDAIDRDLEAAVHKQQPLPSVVVLQHSGSEPAWGVDACKGLQRADKKLRETAWEASSRSKQQLLAGTNLLAYVPSQGFQVRNRCLSVFPIFDDSSHGRAPLK
jgi:hypothetical protein